MVIKKKYHFYAGHRNKSAGVKCGRLHGHTYDVVVHLYFPEWKKDVALLFQDIDDVCEKVIKKYDHYLILYYKDPLVEILEKNNEDFVVIDCESSAENMAKILFDELEEHLPVSKIELSETKSSTVIYEP